MTQTADSPNPADRQALKDAFTPSDTALKVGAHAKENFLSGLTLVLAALGATLIGFPSLHIMGGWVSLGGILVGLYSQLTSATTGERMVNVTAIGAAAVSFAFHIPHGGLY
jgi:hypothetical protein